MRCSVNISIIVDLNSLKVFAEDALLPIHVMAIRNQRFARHIARSVREKGSQVLEQVPIYKGPTTPPFFVFFKLVVLQRTGKGGRTALHVAVLHVAEVALVLIIMTRSKEIDQEAKFASPLNTLETVRARSRDKARPEPGLEE